MVKGGSHCEKQLYFTKIYCLDLRQKSVRLPEIRLSGEKL